LTSAGGGARGADADLVEMVQQVERILVDPVRAGRREVPAAEVDAVPLE
jgi:hypothetical protein